MLRKVKLYGSLKDFVGHSELEAHVNSAAEAIRFLLCNWPQLESHMAEQYYKVMVNSETLASEEIHNPSGNGDIKIVPVVTGAGGDTGKIIAGALLIGVAIMAPGAGMAGIGMFSSQAAAAGGAAAFWGATAAIAGNIGIGLVLSGVAGMLAPQPDIPDYQSEEDPRLSFSFSGVQNTSRAGTPVPICYGEIITGSVQISLGVDTEQVRV